MKNPSLDFIVSASVAMALCVSVSCTAEVPSQFFSINSATVGTTTLDEIQKTYGVAELSKTNQGEEADVLICYVHASPKGESFLVFESGPMGGWKRITGFRISTVRPHGKCTPTKIDISALATGNGIRLGQSLEAFKKAVPVEYNRTDSELTYETVGQRAATQEELRKLRAKWPDEKQTYFEVTILIKAKFQHNRLVELYAHRIESY